jgi:hypothetical protein
MSIQLYNYGEGWVGVCLFVTMLFFYSLSLSLSIYVGGVTVVNYLHKHSIKHKPCLFYVLCCDWVFFLFWNRLMGKVASDKCHKWVFKEPTECEPNISNYWQSSFDAVCIFISFPTPITLLLLSHISLSLSPSLYLESYRV